MSVQTDGLLRILNYTAKATYSGHWNEATVACRGLILDDAGRVVARPFPKFFGPSEPDAPAVPTHQEMEVTAKLDGSLGIAYTHPEGDVRLATRGSLASEQALEATRRDSGRGHAPVRDHLPRQPRRARLRMRDLVLIALIDTETGADIDPGPGMARSSGRDGELHGLQGAATNRTARAMWPDSRPRGSAAHPLEVEVPRLCGRPPHDLRADLHACLGAVSAGPDGEACGSQQPEGTLAPHCSGVPALV